MVSFRRESSLSKTFIQPIAVDYSQYSVCFVRFVRLARMLVAGVVIMIVRRASAEL